MRICISSLTTFLVKSINMKHLLGICFLLLLTASKVFAESEETVYKAYIQPENIILNEGNIFMVYQNELIRIPNLSSDARGYYISSNDRWLEPWRCSVCGQMNLFYHLVCQRCGHLRD